MNGLSTILVALSFVTIVVAAPSNYQTDHDLTDPNGDMADDFLELIDCMEQGFKLVLNDTGHEGILDKFLPAFEYSREHFRGCKESDNFQHCVLVGGIKFKIISIAFVLNVYMVDQELAYKLARVPQDHCGVPEDPSVFIGHTMAIMNRFAQSDVDDIIAAIEVIADLF